jgi:DNA modification methylase
MAKKIVWHNEKRKVKDLIPNPKNPRKISESQTESLKKSLQKFNLCEIPVINTDNQLLAGHQRAKILQLLGRADEEIDVRIPNRKLSKKECEEYLLTSNAVTGSWDMELLKDFPIDTLLEVGFDDSELSEIWDNNIEIDEDNFNEDLELEKAKTTKIKIGDLFKLGSHYLICGNSHEKETLNKLMGTKKIDMVYNDPIYNIGVDYNKGIGGRAGYGGNVKDNKSDDEYKKFLKQGLENSLRHTNENCHIFSWCDQKFIWLLQILYQELGVKNERVCMWVKNGFNPTPNVAFNKAIEPCVYGTVNRPYLSPLCTKASEILNKEIGTGNRAMDDILDIFDIWLAKRDAGSEYNHSTQKPLTLHEKPLKRCTKPGDVVLDIYGGSGSTLLACEQLKRVCYTAEINPIFCQLIINRFESYVNTKAKKIN